MTCNNVDLFEFVNLKLSDPELKFNKLVLHITSCTIVVLDKPSFNKQITESCKSVNFLLTNCKFTKQNMMKCLEELSSCLSSLERLQLQDCDEGFIRVIPAFFAIASKKYHLRRMKFSFTRRKNKDDIYNQEYVFEARNCPLTIVDQFDDSIIKIYADYFKFCIFDITNCEVASKELSPKFFTFKQFSSLELDNITKVELCGSSETKLVSKPKSQVPNVLFEIERSKISSLEVNGEDINISNFDFSGYSNAVVKITLML